jgi:RNA polymerase sigma-70 factor (ECF subfamily)
MRPRFENLIERQHDEIFAYVWRLLGKEHRGNRAMDAEDLVQEVFLRAYRSFVSLRANSNHRAWLYKIATNCAYTRLRQIRAERDGMSSLKSSIDFGSAKGNPSTRTNLEHQLRLLVNELPVKQKACVTLRYLQDLDYPEIAEILGCSQENVRANVYQALRRLRLVWRRQNENEARR